MKPLSIPIDSITVSDRFRSDLGDIDELATSIDRYGVIQPIIINQDNTLIAGGRRLAACRQLGWTTISVVYRETLSQEELHELELEENVRRKDMTWQERVLAVAQLHHAHELTAALSGSKWGFEETGELLGIKGKSHVWYSVEAAKMLLSGDQDVVNCTSLKDVIQLMIKRREDEARHILVSRTLTTSINLPPGSNDAGQVTAQDKVSIDLSKHLFCANTTQFIFPPFDHIITDPPYAINMDMLNQRGTGMQRIEDVSDEHVVEENLELLSHFVKVASRALPNHGFLVIWCDAMHFSWLHTLLTEASLSVQRWPIVWCKPSICLNQAAQYNWTKCTEFAIVARKPGATLVTPQPTNYIVMANEKPVGAHPFYKPHALWRCLYKAFTIPGQTVLDPFAGEGSAVCAAIEYGLKPIGIEVNEKHYNVMVENVRSTYEKLLGKERVVLYA